MRRATSSPAQHESKRPLGALWATISRTLRLLLALALVTVLIVMLLHGLNIV